MVLEDDPQALARIIPTAQLREWSRDSDPWDAENRYPAEAIKDLADVGVLGATFSIEDGGLGATVRQVVEAARTVTWSAPVLARAVVDSNLGPTAMVVELASAPGRSEVLTSIRGGNKPAIAITEPMAGSDLGSIETTVATAGREMVMRGEKRWITGAPVATHYVVFARFEGGGPGTKGIGVVLARAGRTGIECLPAPVMMGMRGLPEGGLVFSDYVVTAEDVLAGPPLGFQRGMALYNSQRLGAAMIAAALAERALALAIARARARKQFGRRLIDNQGLRWQLAELALELGHTLSFIRSVADQANGLWLPRMPVAMAKLHAARVASEAANGALQVFGAEGYSTTAPLERLVRDARMFTIAGGTSEMLCESIGELIANDDLWSIWPFEPAPAEAPLAGSSEG